MTDKNSKNIFCALLGLWKKCIDSNVKEFDLCSTFDALIATGYTAEYIYFCVSIAIKNKMGLRFPGGIKYFAQKDNIKKEYEKYLVNKNNVTDEDFKINKPADDMPPIVSKTVNKKFGNIIKRG